MATFSILQTGLWDVPEYEICKSANRGSICTIPGFAVLIKDDSVGNILFDTGICSRWEETWPEEFKDKYSFKKLFLLEEQLAKEDIHIEDIDLLICSHLHYDHAGNIHLFKNTKAGRSILISEAEAHHALLDTVLSPEGIAGANCRNELIIEGIGYQLLKENLWISDDIYLFIQKGHTPGVIGMLVRTPDGNFIFPSDALHSRKNLGPPVTVPGVCADPDEYRHNISFLMELKQAYSADIVFSHDLDDFNRRI